MQTIMIAVLFDLLLKDPPNILHPTAWMGTLIGRLWGRRTPRSRAGAFIKGMMICIIVSALFGGSARLIERSLSSSGSLSPFSPLIEGLLLHFTFSFTGLMRIGRSISDQLKAGNLTQARKTLVYSLVSRDTSSLSESGVIAATLESLSENLTDSVAAPLLWYLLFGLPGAYVYRVINTCDAMLGYRDAEREWLGKFPARLDDLVNYIPARLTSACILLAGLFVRGRHHGLSVLIADRRKTESPNAGWTMAALAGILDVSFCKEGCYVLNADRPEPLIPDLLQGIQVCRSAGIIVMMTILLIQGLRYGLSL